MNDSTKNPSEILLSQLGKYQEAFAKQEQQKILALKNAYTKFPAACVVFDYLNYAEKHYKTSSVQYLVAATHVDYYDVVKMLKYLDSNKIGQFIVGRKGQDSRIVWLYSPHSIGEVALGKAKTLLPVPKKIEDYDGGAESKEHVSHSFLLRADFKVIIDLPVDFDRSDEKRLAKWLATIPFD